MSHPDTNEILKDTTQYKPSRYDDYDFPQPILDLHEPAANETASWLKSENESLRSEIAYLRGKIEVYEKFLKDRGYIKDEKKPRPVIANGVEYSSYTDYIESRKEEE